MHALNFLLGISPFACMHSALFVARFLWLHPCASALIYIIYAPASRNRVKMTTGGLHRHRAIERHEVYWQVKSLCLPGVDLKLTFCCY